MENRLTVRIVVFIVYCAFALILAGFAPQVTGIMIFGFFLMLARFANADKVMAVHNKEQNKEPDTHRQQVTYSHRYSRKKTESRDAVRDKPLSEAERNVLYGK